MLVLVKNKAHSYTLNVHLEYNTSIGLDNLLRLDNMYIVKGIPQ